MVFGALASFLIAWVRLQGHSPGAPIFEYAAWVIRWVAWLLDWVFRLPLVLLDLLGVELRASMSVSIKILTTAEGQPTVPLKTAIRWLKEAESILRGYRIMLLPRGVQVLPAEPCHASILCAPSGLLRRFFTWFSERAKSGPYEVTVYVVPSIRGATGCAYPGSDWALVTADADGTVLVHEIAHLCDLWGHSSDPDNVMTVRRGGSHDRLTRWQGCALRTSRFARPSFLGIPAPMDNGIRRERG